MGDNFHRMREDGRALFLRYDQEEMLRFFRLDHDGDYLRFSILNGPAALRRTTGEATWQGEPLDDGLALTLYDILSRAEKKPVLRGTWVSINNLGGHIAVGHSQTLRSDAALAALSGRKDELCALCRRWGGTPMERGDVSFVLPLFSFFPVWFRFWDADEDFPAQFHCLWDANTLDFLHYETTWYVVEFLRNRILRELGVGP